MDVTGEIKRTIKGQMLVPSLPWELLRSEESSEVREHIIEACLPFARMLAAKLYAKRTYPELEFHDYFQHASIGLIEAVDRFDPSYGVTFEAFSASRITGAILNGIESLTEKQKQVSARKRIAASRVESLKQQKVEASDPEALFASLADLAIGLAIGFALEDSGMYASKDDTYLDNTYQRIELKQMQAQVNALVVQLRGNEKKVVVYHYSQNLGFEEIAAMLSLTKGRISQIHKEALKKMKDIHSTNPKIDLLL